MNGKEAKDTYQNILQAILELRRSGMYQVPDVLIADQTGLSLQQVREGLEQMRKEGHIILCETDDGYAARAWDRVTG